MEQQAKNQDGYSASAKAGMGAAAACEHKPGPNEIIVCIDKDIFSSLRELAHEHPSIKAERGRLAALNAEFVATLELFCRGNPPKGTTFKQWIRGTARTALAKAKSVQP